MNLLPTDPAQRRRLILLGIVLALMTAAYLKWGISEPPPIPKTTGPAPTSNPSMAIQRSTAKGKKAEPAGPQALKLAQIEDVTDEPEAGRNPFRFGVRPPPPAPPPPPYVPPVYTPPPAPTQPPIPPVPLWLVFIVPAGQQGPKAVAYLHDKAGNSFQGVEGDIIDGRYRLIRIGTNDVVISYRDGTGQRTISPGDR